MSPRPSYVVFGKATSFSSTLELSSLNGSNGFSISGEAASDASGFSVASAGDVNDVFDVNVAGDVVTELAGGGTDTVRSGSISLSLASYANIESLGLTGAANLNLTGNAADNTLTGNGGTNVLTGGRGHDTMTGGLLRDVFDFNSKLESGKTAATRDVITDFTHNLDDIDVRTIDASSKKGDNQNFTFIAKQAFHHKAGELHFKFEGTTKTIVEGDTNGDGRADFQIELTGHLNLTKGDFIL